MRKSNKNSKKHLLALCLSAIMIASVGALSACKGSSSSSSDDSSSSSTSTSTKKDEGLIKNAGFETTNEDYLFDVSGLTGWTKSTNTASSGSSYDSYAASGIVDLETEAWHDLTGSYYGTTEEDMDKATFLTEAEAEKVWDELTTRDKLAFYAQWEKDNKNKTISKELDFYESFNIDIDDVPTFDAANFSLETHDGAVASKDAETDEDEKEKYETKVLMLHNDYPKKTATTNKGMGTAQKFTSSSTVTVKAGTAAQFSVWVKTQDLTGVNSYGEKVDAVGKGAYISVTHSVGGTSLDAFKVENINTELMSESELSNGWKQYSFVLRGSDFTDTTFSVVLGLGQGGGTYRAEYVNGYAFFDDIQCEIIDGNDFDTQLTNMGLTKSDVVGFEHEGADKEVDVYATPAKDNFALDFSLAYHDKAFAKIDDFFSTVEIKATTSKEKDEEYSSASNDRPAPWLNGGLSTADDVVDVFSVSDLKNYKSIGGTTYDNKYLQSIYADYLSEAPTFKNDEILLLMSANGVAYTATPKTSGNDFTFSFAANQKYIAISFFVKTSDLKGFTGAGITLVDGDNESSFTSLDTTDIEAVDIGNNEDVYKGWQKCFFFVENTSDNPTASFSLRFNYGPTSILSTTKDDYYAGFAAFADFQSYHMTKEEYETAQSGTYAKIVSVTDGEKAASSATGGFDTAMATPSSAIKEGLANLQNYKGVYTDSAYITGTGSAEINQHANAGLISKEYFLDEEDGYYKKAIEEYLAEDAWAADTPDWLKALAGTPTAVPTQDEIEALWNRHFGKDTVQPLYIYNDGANAGKSYGYIGNFTTISANSYTAISVRIKGSTNAKASVYLIDTNGESYDDAPTSYNKTLSIGRNLSYWYDEKGNILTGDPDEKLTKIAFKLQSNGLYKANKACKAVYDKLTDKDAWYANLAAYTETDAEGNLLVAKNGASHNYSDYWNNEGMDGIAFYKGTDGKYYADRDCEIPVTDISEIDTTVLQPRYEGIDDDKRLLEENVSLKANEWTTVTFYIHTGDEAKNYRLEIWSGSRTGAGNGEGEYIIVDTVNPGTAQDNFTKLIEYYDGLSDQSSVTKFESVFSYFDTATYLRYNESLDENDIGNLYEDNYDATTQTEGIAYLRYSQDDRYVTFADYQYSEKAVTASTADSDDDSSDDTDSDETESDTNIWLLISSLSIAGILVLAIASIVIRKTIIRIRKKRAAQGYVPKKVKKSKKK